MIEIIKTYENCLLERHPNDRHPTLEEKLIKQVNAENGFPGQPQRKYDLFLSMYNMVWRYYPNLSYI